MTGIPDNYFRYPQRITLYITVAEPEPEIPFCGKPFFLFPCQETRWNTIVTSRIWKSPCRPQDLGAACWACYFSKIEGRPPCQSLNLTIGSGRRSWFTIPKSVGLQLHVCPSFNRCHGRARVKEEADDILAVFEVVNGCLLAEMASGERSTTLRYPSASYRYVFCIYYLLLVLFVGGLRAQFLYFNRPC
jgi:hypothetical protein